MKQSFNGLLCPLKRNVGRCLSTHDGREGLTATKIEQFGKVLEKKPHEESLRSVSRRFVFDYPGKKRKNIRTYMQEEYPGWSAYFHPHIDANWWQRKAMFEKECEQVMFAENPADFDMTELGFSREFEVPKQIVKIQKQKPTDHVLYHDLCEMWKRRQSMDLPFVSVGSFVEVKLRSKWDLGKNVTHTGVVIEKEHRDLAAFFCIRQNVEPYGYGVENYIHMYSPFLESVKVLSFQVRDDKSGTLQCLRDLSADQADIPDPLPEPVFDPSTGLEIPHFVPIRLEYNEYPVRKDAKRQMKNSKHLRPHKSDTLRYYKLWETDPALRYPRPDVRLKKNRV